MESIDDEQHSAEPLAYAARAEVRYNVEGIIASVAGALTACGLFAISKRWVGIFFAFACFASALVAVVFGLAAVVSGWPRRRWGQRRAGVDWLGVVGLLLGAGSWAVAAIAVTMAPLHQTRDVALPSQCASHLRALGEAMFRFAADHEGRLPDRLEDLVSDEVPPEAFVAPGSTDSVAQRGPTTRATADNLSAGGHVSYVYVGRGVTSRDARADVVLAYGPHMPRRWGVVFLYGDGHVEKFAEAEADRMAEELKAGHNPPRPRGQ